jgi:hypothetical protein
MLLEGPSPPRTHFPASSVPRVCILRVSESGILQLQGCCVLAPAHFAQALPMTQALCMQCAGESP